MPLAELVERQRFEHPALDLATSAEPPGEICGNADGDFRQGGGALSSMFCSNRVARSRSTLPRGRSGGHAGGVSLYQEPVLAMLVQGSAGGSASPACKSSREMPSGVRIKAMRPSRGGRLIVTPWAIKALQVS